MDELLKYATLVLAGVLAGGINTVAGGGSFIALPALMALGLSPGVANGSNRIAILFQSAIASTVFARSGQLHWRRGLKFALIASVGAGLGAMSAAALSESIFQRIFGVLFIIMSIVMVFKRRALVAPQKKAIQSIGLVVFVFLLIGFYGGFIQAGVGILMLLAFSIVLDWDLVAANGLKNFIVFLYTIPALLVFVGHGLVDYRSGSLLAIGNIFGGYWGAKWTLKQGHKWVLAVVVLVSLFSGFRMLFGPLS